MNSSVLRTRYVAAALAVLTLSFVLVKTGRDALYFQEGGLFSLPLAYLGITALSGPMAMFVLELMRIFGPRRARLLTPLIMAAALMAYASVASPGGGWINTLFFMFVPLAWGVMFSLSWLLAADLLEGESTATLSRSYARLGAASILGGTAGGGVAKLLASAIDPGVFVVLGAAGLGVSMIIMARAQNRFAAPAFAHEERPLASRDSYSTIQYYRLLRNRYCAMLLGVAMLAALVGVLVEFQFYLSAATSGNSARENASFFASFYLILNGAAFFVQIYLMPRLQRWAGVRGSLMILPVALLGGAAALLLMSASVILRSGLRVAEGGIKSSIHRSNWEQAYLPLDRTKRAMAKILIDGMGARTGEGVAATALFLWLHYVVGDEPLLGQNTTWVSVALVVTTLSWILLTRRLRGLPDVNEAPPDTMPRLPDT